MAGRLTLGAGRRSASTPRQQRRRRAPRHTIRQTIPFNDPDEAMILPESIDTLIVVRGGLESTRSHQTFTDYRRFLTAGRIVK